MVRYRWIAVLAVLVVALGATFVGHLLVVMQREHERVAPEEKSTRDWLVSRGASFAKAGPEKHIVRVDFSGTDVTDGELRRLATLSRLTDLRLSNTSITDAGLAALEPLRNLKYLDVSNTNVTQQGIVELRNPRLEIIAFGSGEP